MDGRGAIDAVACAQPCAAPPKRDADDGDAVGMRQLDLSRVTELVQFGVWGLDAVKRTVRLSEEMQIIVGASEPIIELDALYDLFIADARPALVEAFEGAIARRAAIDVELRLAGSPDDPIYVRLQSESVANRETASDDALIMGCAVDVTEDVLKSDDIALLATLDYLTEVNNRANFTKLFQKKLSEFDHRSKRLVLILIDIDHFKTVNDSFGHDVGDTLLREVSTVLTRATRGDDVVGRLGGDEFGVVADAPGTYDLGRILSDRILEFADASEVLRRIGGGVTLSLGVAELGPELNTVKSGLKAADLALYEAKRAGRNQAAYYRPALGREYQRRERILADVEAAISAGEIIPHYQPKLCMRTGSVEGVEALARWRRGPDEILTPGAFAEALDDLRLSTKISVVVLEQAMRDLAKAREKDVAFGSIAINITEKQIANSEFLDTVDALLTTYDLPPQSLALEITEAVFLARNACRIRSNMQALHDRGVAIALDDFGTGYASLTHLRAFSIDTLKIDKGFIFDLDNNHESRVISHAVIRMAHDLGMTVVAEGVETAESAEILSNYGCDYAQGFHFARPMGFDALCDFARARSGARPQVVV